MAVLAAVVGFTHLLAGFDNPALARAVATLLGCPYTSRQATYLDLSRNSVLKSVVNAKGALPQR